MGFQIKVNCTVHWAFLKKPNPMSKKHEVVLGNLSDEAATNLRGAGIKVHNKPDDKPEQGRHITCRSTLPIKAEDQNEGQIEALIGNGSRAIATIGVYDWEYEGRRGKSPALYKLVITDLVEVARREQAPV